MISTNVVTNLLSNLSDLYHHLGYRAADQRASLDVLQAASVHGIKYQSLIIRVGPVLWVGRCWDLCLQTYLSSSHIID